MNACVLPPQISFLDPVSALTLCFFRYACANPTISCLHLRQLLKLPQNSNRTVNFSMVYGRAKSKDS